VDFTPEETELLKGSSVYLNGIKKRETLDINFRYLLQTLEKYPNVFS